MINCPFFIFTGLGIPDLLTAVLTLMPLDSYVSEPVSFILAQGTIQVEYQN